MAEQALQGHRGQGQENGVTDGDTTPLADGADWAADMARRVLEDAPVGFVVVRGPQHIVVFANPAYRQLQLRPDLAPVGLPFATLNPPALDGGGQVAVLDMAWATGQPQNAVNLPLLWRGAVAYRLTVQVTPLGDATMLVTVQATGVTPLSATDQLQTLIDAFPEGVAICTVPDGRYIAANSTARAMLSLPDDLTQTPVTVTEADAFRPYAIYYPDGRLMPPALRPLVRTLLQGETCTGEEIVIRDQAGRKTYALCSTAPLRDADGRVSGAMVVLQSLERLRSEEQSRRMLLDQIARERDFVRATIAQMPEAVVIIEQPQGTLKMYNRAAVNLIRAITGESPTRLLARMRRARKTSFADFYQRYPCYYRNGQLCPLNAVPLVRALNEGVVTEGMELSVLQPDGTFLPLLVSAAPVYPPGAGAHTIPFGAVAVVQDISRLKEVDRLKDTFLSIAAHELKTPLTSIKGYAQLLLRKADPQGAEVRGLRVIDRQAAILDRMVTQLLELSRIQESRFSLNVSDFDLVTLLEEARQVQQAASDAHTIRLQSDCTTLTVTADRERLKQVVLNLLSNGIRYSPQGGPVDISLRYDAAAQEAVVAVRDEGVGIPASSLDHIFERFFQAPNATARNLGGMGLGLYVSNIVVQAHKGRMHVESEENRGATFFVHLPIKA